MRISPECVPCILRVRAKEIIESELSDAEKIRGLKGLLKRASKEVAYGSYTVELAWLLFRYVKEVTGVSDPYKRYKEISNNVVSEVLRSKRRLLEGMGEEERFMNLVLASVNANLIDPGAPPFDIDLRRLSEELFTGRFEVDERGKVYRRLRTVKDAAYILDNAGEAVVDLEIVKLLESMGVNVVVIARSEPYQNDITVEEAKRLGFRNVLGTGSDFPGIWPEHTSGEVLKLIRDVDVVIAKGMANYESFYAKPPKRGIIHVLKAKCRPVASTLGVKEGSNVAKVIKWKLP